MHINAINALGLGFGGQHEPAAAEAEAAEAAEAAADAGFPGLFRALPA